MATVCHPGSGKVSASFAAVAKHYGVSVTICPPRSGNRKGVVEKANHTPAQRCWRTLPDDATIEAAQAVFDTFARVRGDTRLRRVAAGKASVATVAQAEPLAPVPVAPFPATLTEPRVASSQALVAWRGNFYSVPPELARATVTVSVRLGTSIGIHGIHGIPTVVHADRGTSMTSKTVATLLADLGVTRSHSRPRVSNDNPYSESLFKTATSSGGATGRRRCAGAPPAWSRPPGSSAASTATCTYPPYGPRSNGMSPPRMSDPTATLRP